MVSPPPPPPAQAQSLQGSEPLTLFFAAEFMILVVLPFISSQAIYDAFWVCLIGLFLSQMISSVSQKHPLPLLSHFTCRQVMTHWTHQRKMCRGS